MDPASLPRRPDEAFTERIHSEAAFAKLCGTCPIPVSSGMTNKHRLYRGGHRQANAAPYRTAIVRMRYHQPTIDYVARRTTEGLTKKDISAASSASSHERPTSAS